MRNRTWIVPAALLAFGGPPVASAAAQAPEAFRPAAITSDHQFCCPPLALEVSPLFASDSELHPSGGRAGDPPGAARVAIGAAGGWVAGALAGGVVGHLIAPAYPSEYAPLSDGAAAGALVGMAVGAGVGAHLGNRRRGHPIGPPLASAGVTAGLVLLASVVEDDARRAVVLTIPLAQLAAATLVELATAR